MKKYILVFLIVVISLVSAEVVSADASFEYHYQYNRILKHGSGGNDVVAAKYCLSTINDNYNYEHHGYFDSYTKNMVTIFQMKNGLYVDGIIGSETGAVMEQQCNTIFESNRNPLGVADVDFTFKVTNTSNTSDITIRGIEALSFELEDESLGGEKLDKKAGYDLTFTDVDGKKIRSGRTYSIEPGETISFSVVVDIDVAKTKKGTGKYQITLKSVDWKLGKGSTKTLDLGFVSKAVYLKTK